VIPKVVARRSGGRVATALNKAPTAADPWFFTADDGNTYLVKLAAHDRCAFNEAFFGRLAKSLTLPVPDVVTIEIDQDLVDDDPELSAVKYPAGLHVGVSRLPNGTVDLRGGILRLLGPSLVIDNADALPGTAVFSAWIDDHDHVANDGNWMLQPVGGNHYVVWMIDFGHALRGPHWTAGALAANAVPTAVRSGRLHAIVAPACAMRGAYDPALARVAAITDQYLGELLVTVPAAWDPPAAERDAVIPFLRARAPGLRAVFRPTHAAP
jgi:hypothetical protein